MRLSVFVLTHGRPELLRACVGSVLKDLPPDAELIVLVNGRDPEAEAFLPTVADPRLRWSVSAPEPRALCRNRGFRMARGEILHFLDDDVQVPEGFFARVLTRFDEDPELAILGGPNRTPPESPWRERNFGAVMTSPFAAPMVWRRYGAVPGLQAASEHELILCNLAVRLAKIPAFLRFQRGLKSNEENLFLYQCRISRLRIRGCGHCFVFHRRRRDLNGFVRQIFSYGYGRAQQTRRAPSSTHPIFLVPAIALAVGPAVVALRPGVLLLYGLLALAGAAVSREARAGGLGTVLGSAWLTPLVHVAYGLGFWAGSLENALAVSPPVSERVVQSAEGAGVA